MCNNPATIEPNKHKLGWDWAEVNNLQSDDLYTDKNTKNGGNCVIISMDLVSQSIKWCTSLIFCSFHFLRKGNLAGCLADCHFIISHKMILSFSWSSMQWIFNRTYNLIIHSFTKNKNLKMSGTLYLVLHKKVYHVVVLHKMFTMLQSRTKCPPYWSSLPNNCWDCTGCTCLECLLAEENIKWPLQRKCLC